MAHGVFVYVFVWLYGGGGVRGEGGGGGECVDCVASCVLFLYCCLYSFVSYSYSSLLSWLVENNRDSNDKDFFFLYQCYSTFCFPIFRYHY